MSLKYMCDKCGKKEGIYEVPDGWWCLGCYSSYADHIYEQMKEEVA